MNAILLESNSTRQSEKCLLFILFDFNMYLHLNSSPDISSAGLSVS